MMGTQIVYLDVWQDCPADLQERVRRLWTVSGALRDEVEIEHRLLQLCFLGLHDRDVIGVSTVCRGLVEPLGREFYFFRCLVASAYRRHGVATQLAVRCRNRLESWALDHPDEGVSGMATVVEAPELAKRSRLPVWPNSGLTLIGYNERGQQMRVVWFKHVLL
jgi:hypothetical protein